MVSCLVCYCAIPRVIHTHTFSPACRSWSVFNRVLARCYSRIPLYAYIRLLFLLYLVMPQTQGARVIYTTYIHPYLQDNESHIEDFIATAHDKFKAAGLAYLKRAFEIVRTQVLGLPPSESSSQQQQQQQQHAASNIPASLRPRSYTQSLLDRFQLPQARWPGNAGIAGQDFYNFLSSAVAAAAGSGSPTSPRDRTGGESSSAHASETGVGVGAFPAGDLTASGTLVPPSIRDNAEKMSFLAAQRERLNMVLSALDREAAQLRSASLTGPPEGLARDLNLESMQPLSSLSSSPSPPNERPATSASGRSGLSKSRSEADFEKIEAESGAEDNADPAQESESGRPTPSAAASLGSWMPWGWSGAGSAAAAARDDKSKAE